MPEECVSTLTLRLPKVDGWVNHRDSQIMGWGGGGLAWLLILRPAVLHPKGHPVVLSRNGVEGK